MEATPTPSPEIVVTKDTSPVDLKTYNIHCSKDKPPNLEAALLHLHAGERIVVTGMGSAMPTAARLGMTLMKLGFPVGVSIDVHKAQKVVRVYKDGKPTNERKEIKGQTTDFPRLAITVGPNGSTHQ